ncbi:SHOCT domain-containing protein [Acutalibacter muris]|nr:SHOCT domain-containing protein [Acutalibacter muris]
MNSDINNSAFVYSVNLIRLLLKMQLITQEEYERILEISAAHYGTEKIYV